MTKFVLLADVADGNVLRGLIDTDGPLEERVEMLRNFLVDGAVRSAETVPELDLIAIASGPEHRLFDAALMQQGLDYTDPLPDTIISAFLTTLVEARLVPDEVLDHEEARAVVAVAFALEQDREHDDEGLEQAVAAAVHAWCAKLVGFPRNRGAYSREQIHYAAVLTGAMVVSMKHALAAEAEEK